MNGVIAGAGGCFRKGALVQLEGGKTKPIEEIQIGDEVLSFDEYGVVTKSTVTETHYHPDPEPLLKVRFWQGKTYITPNHWVLNAIKSFSAMGDLGIGEALVDGFGNLRPIISVEDAEAEPVYNLTVEPYHTFICDGIRVHNGGYRASYPTIGGSGGGGKKKKSKGITEAANNLKSNSIVSLLDLIGEGEIGGLVNGAKSIYLDNVPLQNSDGSYNYDSVVWSQAKGSVNQSVLSGFSDVETPFSVGVQVLKSRPVTQEISSIPNADAVRFVVSVDALNKTDSKSGNISGTSVSFRFDYNYNEQGWKAFGTKTIEGKCNSTYQAAYEFTLPKTTGDTDPKWSIRMVRLTADSADSALINNGTIWNSYVVITKTKLNYPSSALVGVTVSAETFSSIPSRSYLVDGLKIRVPNNYTAPYQTTVKTSSGTTVDVWRAATYSGIWNGGFKTISSSNPAWILFDLLTDTRYGLGNFITDDMVDLSMLYKIGKYCDELVLDGFSYTDTSGVAVKTYEPRFQVNTVIQQRSDAYSVISDICSAFRGMAYWTGGEVGFMADMPTGPTMEYSSANVINGTFTYQGAARKDRHSVALVTWNNPDVDYTQEIEYVEDSELIERFGIRETELVDFGCTSRGQARRAGLWTLYTEKYQSETITFDVGIDSSLVLPGDVIKIHDSARAGIRYGGRLTACTTTSATLDNPVTLTDTGAIISIRLPSGKFEDRTVLQGAGSYSTLTWTTALSDTPVSNAIWMLITDKVNPILARVTSVKQKDSATYTITALYHEPSKYDYIEKGLKLEEKSTSIIDLTTVNTPTNLTTKESTYMAATGTIGSKISISWEGDAYGYIVSYRRVSDGDTKSTISQETVTELGEDQYIGETSSSTTDADGNIVTTTVRITGNDPDNDDAYDSYTITTTTTTTYYESVDNWTTVETTVPNYEIENAQPTWYEIKVKAVSLNGNTSGVITGTHTVTGKTASPGKVQGLSVSKRTYDLLVKWNQVTDVDIAGYEIREGPASWDESRLIQTMYSGTSCVDDQDSAGTYIYRIKSIDTSGNYSKESTYTLNLNTPQDVSNFVCVQSGTRIDFKWSSNPETDIVYYEIREGVGWLTGNKITEVMATSYSLASGSVTGNRTFWIKAVASPGIYSNNAVFTIANVTAPVDRNVVFEVDEAEDGWTGYKYNASIVAYSLELTIGQQYGEYIFDIDLGGEFTAQNSINSSFDAVTEDTITWEIANFAWNSSEANRSWVLFGDLNKVDVEYYISLFKGYDKFDDYEVFPLNGDLSGKILETSAYSSKNISYASGRFLQGVNINTTDGYARWDVDFPTVWEVSFWYIPSGFSGSDNLDNIWQARTTDGASLTLSYDNDDAMYVLKDGNDNVLDSSRTDGTKLSSNLGQPTLFCISQTETTRTLKVGIVGNSGGDTEYVSKSATLAPIGAIASFSIY